MKSFLLLAILSTVTCASVSASAATFYVDGAVSSSGDGTSWETAFKRIQEGIDKALEGDRVTVAEGAYVENIQFKGKNIVLTSTDPLDPAVVGSTIIDGNQAGSVVAFSGTETEACVLSGFTIRNGRAREGGGIRGNQTCATIQQNRITGNSAQAALTAFGGGLYQCNGMIQNNTITGTSSDFGGGLYACNGTIQTNTITENSADFGGAFDRCNGRIQNNAIIGNSATGDGGALRFCQGTIQNNAITGNSAQRGGGGLYGCDGPIQNNTIIGNSAAWSGGGLWGCNKTIQNNTIVGNWAGDHGGGLYGCGGTVQNNTIVSNGAGGGGGGLYGCNGMIRNCIAWGNTAPTGPQVHESNVPTFSCVEGWSGAGQGNTASEPRFVSAQAQDYRLQQDSPCIDAGVNGYWFPWPQRDLDGNCRLVGLAVDMGCYEYGSSADADGDLLSDAEESAARTDPLDDDSDGDGLRDGLEVLRGSNPLQVSAPGILNAPSEFATVQLSLCVSIAGDEIIVAPGTYQENLQFCGLDIILRSSDPDNLNIVGSTVIDGGGAGPAVEFTGTEAKACVLYGFTIRNGRAREGGGVKGNRTQATIRNNTITGNSAAYGGGLCECSGAVQNNIITANAASEHGGGVWWCTGTIENNTITANSAEWSGGGLCGGDGAIHNNMITGNSAENGGGGLAMCDGTISNNRITGNGARCDGGGLYECEGPIQNNVISTNWAGGYGGGLYQCSATIDGNTIGGNSGGDWGGGLYDCDGAIQNNTITGNLTYWDGGGLAKCDGTIQSNTITGNSAREGGGGLYQCNGTIQNNTITGNSAEWTGGGLYQCNGTVQNNSITGNSADSGGGLSFCDGTIQNNTIMGNGAGYDGGGLADCDGRIQNNTITVNLAGDYGGGLAWCNVTILNCIIWANAAASEPQLCNSSQPVFSCIEGWSGGGQNIASEPRFINPGAGDYRLQEGSLCIDAGFNSPYLAEYDAAGMHRIMFGGKSLTVDMGAYEFHIWPPTENSQTGEITLRWSSLAGKTYSVYCSSDMLVWDILTDNVPSAGDTATTWIDSMWPVLPRGVRRRYYKVIENE